MQASREVGIGHNMGPPWERAYLRYCWEQARKQAWKLPDRMIVERRLKRAAALGMTYREYVLEILERGRYL